MKRVSVMIKPASSLCNMRCTYCFYANVSDMRAVRSYGIMSEATADAVIAGILRDLDPGDSLSVAFQGGEPTLAGLGFYRHFVKEMSQRAKGIRLEWAFQTNGLLLDEDWCAFFAANNFLVGLSLDLQGHDKNRLDAKGMGTHKRVRAAKSLLEKHKVEYNVLCVLTNSLARHPAQVWRAVLAEGIGYVQFIPCMDGLDTEEPYPWALRPQRFAQFYNGLIPLWQKELAAGRYVSVKLIDDLVNLLAAGVPGACGMLGLCAPQFVVEADGGVYPCDFYVLDEHRLGSFCTQGPRELFQKAVGKGFANSEPGPAAKPCEGCPYWQMCGGGCKRMAGVLREENYCGYRAVLEQNMPLLQRLAAGRGR